MIGKEDYIITEEDIRLLRQGKIINFEVCSEYGCTLALEKTPYDLKKNKWIKINNPNYSPFDRSSEYIYICPICGEQSERATPYCAYCGNIIREATNRRADDDKIREKIQDEVDTRASL